MATLLGALVEDEQLLDGDRTAAAVVAAQRRLRSSPVAPALGPLVVPDHRLAELARALSAVATLPVGVVNGTGAGGLVWLADRPSPGLQVVAVESALRDLDDLAGNAARVVAAAEQLPEGVRVLVGLPDAVGWQRAAEVVEAAGCLAVLRLASRDDVTLAQRLSVLIEADLPVKVAGPGTPDLPALLAAVGALVDGADPTEAAELLGAGPPTGAGEPLLADDAWSSRVRRRLVAYGSTDVPAVLRRLHGVGLTPTAGD